LDVTPVNEGGPMTYEWSGVDLLSTHPSYPAKKVTTTTPYLEVAPKEQKNVYNVLITSNTTKCSSAYEMIVNVNEAPLVFIDATKGELEPCKKSYGEVVAGGASTYKWYEVNADNTEKFLGYGDSKKVYVENDPVTVRVYGYDAVGCEGKDKIVKTLTPTPDPEFTVQGPSGEICAGTSITLFAESKDPSKVYQYTWYDPILDQTKSGPQYIGSPMNSTQFDVTGTFVTKQGTKCSSHVAFTQNVSELPQLTITPDSVDVCDGVEYEFTATGATSYVWQHDATKTNDKEKFKFNYGSGAVAPVVVVGKKGACTSSPKTIYVYVHPSPDLIIEGTPEVCGNNQAKITAKSSADGASYFWSTEKLTSQTIEPVVQPANQTFPCTVTDAYGCYTTKEFTVDVVPAPTLYLTANYFDSPLTGTSIAPDDKDKYWVNFCDGDSLDLTIRGASKSVDWVMPNKDTLCWDETYHIRPKGDMEFAATGHLNGCHSTINIGLKMNQKPTLFLLSDTIVCRGESQDVVVSGSGYGKKLYNWSMKEHNNSGYVEGADTLKNVIAERPITDTLNNIYTVSVKIDETGCTNTKSFHYGYVKSPEFSVDGERAACVGNSLMLKAIPDNPDDKYSYTWTSEDNLVNKTGDSIAYTFRTEGEQPKIKVSAYDGGCRVYEDVILTGWTAPGLKAFTTQGTFENGQVTICENTSFSLSIADTSTSTINYWWVKGNEIVSNTSALHNVAKESETYLGYARNRNGCESVIPVPVVVEFAPIATNVFGGDTIEICSMDTAKFSLSPVDGVTYSWDDDDRTTGNVLEVAPSITRKYLVNVKGANGCERPQYFTALVNSLPSVQFATVGGVKGDNLAACYGSEYKLVVSPRIDGDYSYLWDTKSGLDTLYLRANSMATEKHVVNITDKATGCKAKDSIEIRTQELPTITSTGVTEVCRGDRLLLNAGGAATYFWMRGTDTLAKSAALRVDNLTSPGTYTAYGDDRGCIGKKEVNVTVRSTPNIYLNAASAGVVENNTVSLCDGASVLELQVASRFEGGDPDASDLQYTWSNLMPTDNATDQNLTINSVQTKDYMVKVARTDNPNACPGSEIISVRVMNKPRIYVKGNRNVCFNDYTELVPYGDTDDSFDNYEWRDTRSSLGKQDTLKTLVTEDMTYTVIGTNTKTGCQSEISYPITKVDAPTVTLDIRGQDNNYVCAGNQFVVQAHGAYSYLWKQGKDTLSTEDAYGDIAKTQTTYFVEGSDVNGCKGNASITVDVRPTPVIWTDGNKPICLGDKLELEAKGADNYRWSTGIVSGTNNEYMTAEPKYSTSVTLTGYDLYGCATSMPVEITVRDTPNVIIRPEKENEYNDGICEGKPVSLIAEGADTYQWTKGTQSLSNVVNQVVTEDQTLFEVEGTDKLGCKSTARYIVKMNPRPELTITGDTIICEGDKVSLNVAGVGAKTFAWGDGSIVGNKLIDKPKHDTIYVVSGTSMYGCTQNKTIPVIVNPLPSISIYGETEICQGDTTQLYALGAKSYVWSSGNRQDTITVKPTKDAVYQVTGTDEKGCTATETISIHVNEMPNLYIQSSAGIICEGDSVKLTAKVTNGDFDNYYWSSKNGIMGNTYGSSITAYLEKTDTFYVTAKNDVCSNVAMTTVATYPKPTLSYIGESVVCQGDRLQLIGQGAATYEWILPDESKVSSSILSFVPTEPTVMPIKLVGVANSCKAEETYNIEVKPSPVMSIAITGGEGASATDGYVCRGSDYSVIASGADTYVWSTGDIVDEIRGTNLVTPMNYTVTGTNVYNCSTKVAVTVPLMTLPKVKIIANKSAVCPNQGDSIHFEATGAETYTWSSYPPIADIDNDPIRSVIDAGVSDSGWVYLAGVDENMCVGYDSIKIKSHDLDNIKYVVNPQLVDENYKTVSLSGRTPSSELYPVEWSWSLQDGTELTGKAVKHTFDVLEDSILVTARAKDWNGCVYEGSSYIYKWKSLWAPSKFTPDTNGLNDKFQFEGGDWITDFNFIIYNRLGEVVFEGHSLRDAWDGTFKGKPCAPGVYGWNCSYKSTVGSYTKSGEEKGKITLIR